jgi:hypothetical protein
MTRVDFLILITNYQLGLDVPSFGTQEIVISLVSGWLYRSIHQLKPHIERLL